MELKTFQVFFYAERFNHIVETVLAVDSEEASRIIKHKWGDDVIIEHVTL